MRIDNKVFSTAGLVGVHKSEDYIVRLEYPSVIVPMEFNIQREADEAFEKVAQFLSLNLDAIQSEFMVIHPEGIIYASCRCEELAFTRRTGFGWVYNCTSVSEAENIFEQILAVMEPGTAAEVESQNGERLG